MLRLRAFRGTNDKIVKIAVHPTHPWLVTADASDYVSVWNWEHRQIIYEFKAGGVDHRRLVGAKLEKLAEGDASKGKHAEAIRGGSVKQVSFFDDDVRYWQYWRNHSAAAEAPSATNNFDSAFRPSSIRGQHYLVVCCENKAIFLDLVTMRGRDVPKFELDNKSLLCLNNYKNWTEGQECSLMFLEEIVNTVVGMKTSGDSGKIDDRNEINLLEEELIQLTVKSSLVTPSENPTLLCPVWTRKSHNPDSLLGPCPPECDKKDLMHAIGSTFGGVIRAEIKGEFCRIRVNLNIQKQLRRGLDMGSKNVWKLKRENVIQQKGTILSLANTETKLSPVASDLNRRPEKVDVVQQDSTNWEAEKLQECFRDIVERNLLQISSKKGEIVLRDNDEEISPKNLATKREAQTDKTCCNLEASQIENLVQMGPTEVLESRNTSRFSNEDEPKISHLSVGANRLIEASQLGYMKMSLRRLSSREEGDSIMGDYISGKRKFDPEMVRVSDLNVKASSKKAKLDDENSGGT
ncbi:hypothetical protein GOBAR_AA05992 [Gossypium barbadense]|uniref:Coatomer WD associated region domain-containing protein n=1 Tax=Gossypium barbadense TaxID=3634 RepID=A0A2P5YGA2_GOSBA|nr:hypothetical protein GOBAR_AA05992 [Gossypium barbadense]